MTLTVRACRRGVVDFSQAAILDARWWRRANLLIDGMARDDDLEIVKASMAFHLALVSNPQLTDESWKGAKTAALELFNDVINISHPWAARSTADRKKDEYDSLFGTYKKVIGDLDDPKFKKVIEEETARLRRKSAAPAETAEQVLARRLMDRDRAARGGRRG